MPRRETGLRLARAQQQEPQRGSLCCLSRCPTWKPDNIQLVYWQRESQYGFTVLIQLTPHRKTERCPARTPAARTTVLFSALFQPTARRKTR